MNIHIRAPSTQTYQDTVIVKNQESRKAKNIQNKSKAMLISVVVYALNKWIKK